MIRKITDILERALHKTHKHINTKFKWEKRGILSIKAGDTCYQLAFKIFLKDFLLEVLVLA